jgi:hypothetical protein
MNQSVSEEWRLLGCYAILHSHCHENLKSYTVFICLHHLVIATHMLAIAHKLLQTWEQPKTTGTRSRL